MGEWVCTDAVRAEPICNGPKSGDRRQQDVEFARGRACGMGGTVVVRNGVVGLCRRGDRQ